MPSTTWSPSSAEAGGPDPLERLATRLGHTFDDLDLLGRALTHRSWCAEHPGETSNERLEFLGDAVLGLVVAEHLYARCPELSEGALSKARASVVNAEALAAAGRTVGLGPGLRLGRGEDLVGGRDKTSILADAMEAVIGAVFLDGGLEPARRVILAHLAPAIEAALAGPGAGDHKTRLQELAARRFDQLPVYEVHGEGPDHEKRFFARVRLGGVERGRGEGRTKKQAEQAAAQAAWRALVGGTDGDAGPPTPGGSPTRGDDA
jgi:ribonuclease-3